MVLSGTRALFCASMSIYTSALSERNLLRLCNNYDLVINEFETIDGADNFARHYSYHVGAKDPELYTKLKTATADHKELRAGDLEPLYSWQQDKPALWIRSQFSNTHIRETLPLFLESLGAQVFLFSRNRDGEAHEQY